MKNWPLRVRLTLWAALVVALALSVFAAGTAYHLGSERVAALDRDMRKEASGFFAALQAENWSGRGNPARYLPNLRRRYYTRIEQAGVVLHEAHQLAGMSELPTGKFFSVEAPKGGHFRVAKFSEGALTLLLAGNLDDVDEIREDLLLAYLFALPLVMIAVGGGGWFISKQALAPVQRIASTAEHITAQQLTQRLPAAERMDEIGQLTTVLNKMIDRLEASFRQATRFTADASHELRTPLTIIRGELENALQEVGPEPREARLLVNLLEETNRLSHIVDNLLLLSRADVNKLVLAKTAINLAALLRDLLEDVEILGSTLSISLEANLPESALVQGDAGFLRQLLLNLLDNAVKYNVPHGWIKISLTASAEQCAVVIANSGPGIGEQDAVFVFDRFFRAPTSDHVTKGYGLGLSLCREIARAHGGDVVLSHSGPAETEFTLTLPLG